MSGPVTAIWAVVGPGPWQARVVHWNKIDYPAQKGMPAGATRQPPDFQGEVLTMDGKPITDATVEGRLLRAELKPPATPTAKPSHIITFLIDPNAAKGPQGHPVYQPTRELAKVAGYASHTLVGDPNKEFVKAIYRDNFFHWGDVKIRQGGGPERQYELKPMYFIPHSQGISGFTEPREQYTNFNTAPSGLQITWLPFAGPGGSNEGSGDSNSADPIANPPADTGANQSGDGGATGDSFVLLEGAEETAAETADEGQEADIESKLNAAENAEVDHDKQEQDW